MPWLEKVAWGSSIATARLRLQASEVDKVKRSESGMIVDPITLPPTATLAQAKEIMAHYHISGVPITEGPKLVGILTNRDIRFATEDDKPVTEFMTSEGLVVAPLGTTLEEALKHPAEASHREAAPGG